MKIHTLLLASLVAAAVTAMPRAENVTFVQNGPAVSISYTLTEAPAIVTLDIQTNVTGDVWASIGGENIVNGISADSDVFKKVSGTGPLTIKWTPNRAWADHNQAAGKVRAVVTAHSLANPPDYMAVDITEHAQPNTQRYYPSADFVPGGVTNCTTYRTSMMLMRRIHARNKTFTMGSIGESGRAVSYEATRMVTLTNDYYMAVFEATQSQWLLVKGGWPETSSKTSGSSYTFIAAAYREMRPAQNISYNEIRTSGAYDTYNEGNEFPNPPHANSFLGKLRLRTGIDFDLPSEAQWEYACRAGHGEGEWNNGSSYSDASAMPGRYSGNGGSLPSDVTYSNCGPEYGTAICGTYAPSSWGLYDMHGNVAELCVDWFQASVPSGLDYRANINLTEPQKCFDGTAGSAKIKRGGSYAQAASAGRSAARNSDAARTQYNNFGCRVICPVETN